jgi:hypothetical protein
MDIEGECTNVASAATADIADPYRRRLSGRSCIHVRGFVRFENLGSKHCCAFWLPEIMRRPKLTVHKGLVFRQVALTPVVLQNNLMLMGLCFILPETISRLNMGRIFAPVEARIDIQ